MNTMNNDLYEEAMLDHIFDLYANECLVDDMECDEFTLADAGRDTPMSELTLTDGYWLEKEAKLYGEVR